jgi:hypothetical protein
VPFLLICSETCKRRCCKNKQPIKYFILDHGSATTYLPDCAAAAIRSMQVLANENHNDDLSNQQNLEKASCTFSILRNVINNYIFWNKDEKL